MHFFLSSRPRCPVCDKLLDGATMVEGETQPQPGDVTVCGGCWSCLRYTEDMQLAFQRIGSLPDHVQRRIIAIRMAMIAASGKVWGR